MEPVDDTPALEPPSNPDEWTDAQWLAWLKSTDEAAESDDAPAPLTSRVAHSTVGAVIGQAMLGMARAIYGQTDDELVILSEGDGQRRDDEPFTVRLDFEHPERSSVVFTDRSDPTPNDD